MVYKITTRKRGRGREGGLREEEGELEGMKELKDGRQLVSLKVNGKTLHDETFYI